MKKNYYFKRIMSIVVAVCIVANCSLMTYAQEDIYDQGSIFVNQDREKVIRDNDSVEEIGSDVELPDNSWSFDEASNTLTLDNYHGDKTFDIGEKTAQIYSQKDLTVVLIGDNYLDNSTDYGIYCNGNLTISGMGTIIISNSETGIYTRKELSITSKGCNANTISVEFGDLNVDNSSLVVENVKILNSGKFISQNAYIEADVIDSYNILATDSTVYSRLEARKDITLNNTTFTCENDDIYCIHSAGNFSSSNNSTINVRGSSKQVVYVEGDFTLYNTSFTVQNSKEEKGICIKVGGVTSIHDSVMELAVKKGSAYEGNCGSINNSEVTVNARFGISFYGSAGIYESTVKAFCVSEGLSSYYVMTIENSDVIAIISGLEYSQMSRVGISVGDSGQLKICNSTIDAQGVTDGIYCRKLNVYDSKIKATGVQDPNSSRSKSCGIDSYDEVSIEGGIVEATGLYGISSKNVSIKSGKTIANGSQYGIKCKSLSDEGGILNAYGDERALNAEEISISDNKVISTGTSEEDAVLATKYYGEQYIKTVEKRNHSVSFVTGIEQTIDSQDVMTGDKISEPEEPRRLGYSFEGWFTSETVQNENTKWDFANGIVEENIILYAAWKANEYVVSFESCGGEEDIDDVAVKYGNAYGILPTPTRDGYTFDGWYTAASGGTKITSTSVVSIDSDHTLYAHWVGNPYTVTFDANGGSVDQSSKTVNFGSTYGLLPTPSHAGYIFEGWYTGKDTGDKVQATSTVSIMSDHTLYAHWKQKRNDAKVTSITLSDSSMTLLTGDYGQISVTKILPEDAETSIEWYSNKPYVVSVDGNGGISALAAGNAVITAKATNGGATATCSVTVEARVESLEITGTDVVKVMKNAYFDVRFNEGKSQPKNQKVHWEVSGGNAEITDNGTLLAKEPGTYTIRVVSDENSSVSATKTVVAIVPLVSAKASNSSVVIANGKTFTITPVITSGVEGYVPTGTTLNKTVLDEIKWNLRDSDDGQYVSVSAAENGAVNITALAPTNKTVVVQGTFRTYGATNDTAILVNVSVKNQKVKTIKFVTATKKLHYGETATFMVETTPIAPVNDTLTWTSNTPSLTINGARSAKVNVNESVTVAATGNVSKKATITVKASNGVKKTYVVTIMPIPTEVKLTSKAKNAADKTYYVAVGKTLPLMAKPYAGKKATTDKITWSSNNEGVTFTKTGVKINKPGIYQITATTYGGENDVSASCTIIGYKAAAKLSLNKTKVSLKKAKEESRYVILQPTVSPADVSEIDQEITWTVSNTSLVEVATVEKNSTTAAAQLSYASTDKKFKTSANQAIAIKAVKKGTVRFTGKTLSGKTVTCQITIK